MPKLHHLTVATGADPDAWKPRTLQATVLLGVVMFAAGMIAILEYLSYMSHRDGGIAFTDIGMGFSSSVSFLFLYLPTVIAVMFSLLWSWIDLDAKRLEPYFQMSKKDGALSEDSVKLHYPFEFVAFAPIRAIRRR